jgi:hypothetical protein
MKKASEGPFSSKPRREAIHSLAFLLAACVSILALPAWSQSTGYAANSIVIPMDTTYQDSGMFQAYGLVYQLLKQGIPVDWAITSPKSYGEVDFTAGSMRVITPTGFGSNTFAASYRGGPFIIDASYYSQALPIIQAWIGAHTNVAAHRSDAAFTANLERRLFSAPNIAVFLDGNEVIAFNYMNAAAIPMSDGRTWPTANAPSSDRCPSPNCMSESQIAGTLTTHPDGVLLDASGRPTVCQIMSMHYAPSNTDLANEVAREIRDYLTGRPVHAFFECEAVNWFEDLSVAGPFITTNRLAKANQPSSVDYLNSERPFAQADGSFTTQGGSMPAFKFAAGSSYYSSIAVMVKKSGAAVGVADVWMTDNLDGNPANGKISYLGGHQYGTALPMSSNPKSQGTRYFLDALFEAPCASEAVSTLAVSLDGPARTSQTRLQYTLHYSVTNGYSYQTTLSLPLPTDVSFVAASGGGTFSGGTVTWSLGTLSPGSSGDLTVDVDITNDGSYVFTAQGSWTVGLTGFQTSSNTFETIRDTVPPAPGVSAPILGGATTVSGTSSSPEGSQITVTANGKTYNTTVQVGGTWSVPVQALPVGSTVSAIVTVNGHASPPSNTVTVVYTPPALEGQVVAGAYEVGGASSAEPGTAITVYVNGQPVGTTQVQSDGTWVATGLGVINPGDVVTATVGSGAVVSPQAAPSTASIGLLRYGQVTQLDPQEPSNASIFPRAYPQWPSLGVYRDVEKRVFASRDSFTHENSDLEDGSAPLIFYEVTGASGNTLRVTKDGGKIVITY